MKPGIALRIAFILGGENVGHHLMSAVLQHLATHKGGRASGVCPVKIGEKFIPALAHLWRTRSSTSWLSARQVVQEHLAELANKSARGKLPCRTLVIPDCITNCLSYPFDGGWDELFKVKLKAVRGESFSAKDALSRPDLTSLLQMATAVNLELRVLAIYRDPLTAFTNRRMGGAGLSAWRAKLVLDQLTFMQSELVSVADPHLLQVLRYESICNHTHTGVTQRIADFLNIPFDLLNHSMTTMVRPCLHGSSVRELIPPSELQVAQALLINAEKRWPLLARAV